MAGELCALTQMNVAHFYQELLGLSGQKLKLLLKHPELKQKTNKKNGIIEAREELKIPLDILNYGVINPIYVGPEIDILDINENFIVLNKPAGIHGHPLRYMDQSNCLSFLRSRGFNDVLAIDSHKFERGMLYRLDGVTSGLLVFARNEEVYRNIRKGFEHNVGAKTYLAVVEGHFEGGGIHSLFFYSHQVKGHQMVASSVQREDAIPGTIEINPIYQDTRFSIIKILLKEGLRHQIRASLKYLGHPIVGDELYGAKPDKRVYLHALSYEILGQAFYAPIDLFFRDFLDLHGLMEVLHDQL